MVELLVIATSDRLIIAIINTHNFMLYSTAIKGWLIKNVTNSKFERVIRQEPYALGGCPSHRL